MRNRRVEDTFSRLHSFFESEHAWSPSTASYERRSIIKIDSTRWTLICKIHAAQFTKPGVQLRASITLWPSGRARKPDNGWHPALLKRGWYEKSQRELRRYGYRGRWQESPSGRFGDFWKRIDSKKLASEARALDGIEMRLASA